MPYITVGTENEGPIQIHYTDHGRGDVVVLVHAYPLTGISVERQAQYLVQSGYRVVTYDRRGFGRSSRPSVGYDYASLTSDLHRLFEHLDLQDVVLVGFSLGTVEVSHYLGRYGSQRVRRAALIGGVPPLQLTTDDNPYGVAANVFADLKSAIALDRYTYLGDFLDRAFNVDKLMPERISERAWQASFNVAADSSPSATLPCLDALRTDLRSDVAEIDVPVLVIHGAADRILPFEATAERLPALIDNVTVVEVEHGPHYVAWTHPDDVNNALMEFLREPPR